jgi:hypothetical protein
MKENYFSKKMSKKSDEELEKVIADTVSFVPDARQAAIWELEKRKGKSELIIEAEEDFEVEKVKIARQSDFLTDDEILDSMDPSIPTLYSKTAIILLCGVFNTLFGMVLYMINLHRLNKKPEMLIALLLGIFYTIFIMVLAALFLRSGLFIIVLNLVGGLILAEGLWNTQIGKEFKFNKRNYLIPFVISAAVAVVFYILLLHAGVI